MTSRGKLAGSAVSDEAHEGAASRPIKATAAKKSLKAVASAAKTDAGSAHADKKAPLTAKAAAQAPSVGQPAAADKSKANGVSIKSAARKTPSVAAGGKALPPAKVGEPQAGKPVIDANCKADASAIAPARERAGVAQANTAAPDPAAAAVDAAKKHPAASSQRPAPAGRTKSVAEKFAAPSPASAVPVASAALVAGHGHNGHGNDRKLSLAFPQPTHIKAPPMNSNGNGGGNQSGSSGESSRTFRDDPLLDKRIIEGMLDDKEGFLDDMHQEGFSREAVVRRAAELGLSEALIRQVKGVAADLAGERPGKRPTPSSLGARTCLQCDRVFFSSGPGNRLCTRCRGGDAGLAQL